MLLVFDSRIIPSSHWEAGKGTSLQRLHHILVEVLAAPDKGETQLRHIADSKANGDISILMTGLAFMTRTGSGFSRPGDGQLLGKRELGNLDVITFIKQ